MLVENFKVNSDKVAYTDASITSTYEYQHTELWQNGPTLEVTPKTTTYQFKTDAVVPKLGVMLVGLGGNNGTTVTGGILANKHGMTWQTKEGLRTPNYWGSLTQAATAERHRGPHGRDNNKRGDIPRGNTLPRGGRTPWRRGACR